jgi:hypothetical protein
LEALSEYDRDLVRANASRRDLCVRVPHDVRKTLSPSVHLDSRLKRF